MKPARTDSHVHSRAGSYTHQGTDQAYPRRNHYGPERHEFALGGGYVMLPRHGFRVTGGLICLAALAVANAGPSGRAVAPPSGPPLAPRAHGFTLYLSRSVGGGAAGGMQFGLRLEQVRMLGNSGAPDAGDPMQHRALLGWQMGGGGHSSDMHLELGGRMAYDLKQGRFSLIGKTNSGKVNSPQMPVGRPQPFQPLVGMPNTPHFPALRRAPANQPTGSEIQGSVRPLRPPFRSAPAGLP